MEIQYRLSPDVCFSIDHDGTAVLNVESGKFHSLIGTASMVWAQIAAHPQGIRLPTLVDKVLAELDELSDEPRGNVERTLEELLDKFMEIGIVERSDSPTRRTPTSVGKWSSAVLANLSRRITDLLIKLRQPRAAAFIEFAMFHLVRKLGRFSARHRIVKHWPVASAQQQFNQQIPQLCAAVNDAATWYPKESLCLQKASVTTCLLRQHGVQAKLKIGVRKQPFYAHAWVEVADRVVGDHEGVQKYFKVIAVW